MKKAVIAVTLVIVLALTASNVLLWLDQVGTVDLVGGPSPQSPSGSSPSNDLESRISALEKEVGMKIGADPRLPSFLRASRIDSLEEEKHNHRYEDLSPFK